MKTRPAKALVLVAALALVITACGGGPVAPDDDNQPPMLVGGVPLAARDPALVGTWFQRSIVTDGTGRFVSVETIWNFGGDGTVQRRSITDDLTAGIASELVAAGTWTTSSITNTGTGTGTGTGMGTGTGTGTGGIGIGTGGIGTGGIGTGTGTGAGSSGGTLTVRFDTPTAMVLQLAYQIGLDSQGAELLLDGILYQRTIQ